MTTLRQIESNRRNALKSTGPKTESGKQRSSRNAVRHGLTAETVIRWLEDPDDYEAFELAVTADYHAETAVERELVLRLASLLWRLRRATSIETGLLQNIVGHSRTQLPAPPKVSGPTIPGPTAATIATASRAKPILERHRIRRVFNLTSRGVSSVLPVSTMVPLSVLAVMRARSGAKRNKRC